MQLSSYVPLSSLVASVLRSQISPTPTASTTSPLSLRPSPTTPSPISSSSPSSSSSPYYSPSTHYIVTTTSSSSFLLQIQQTYLVSGTSTSSLPTSGASIDPAIPMWKPTPVSAFAVVTGLGPGVASDGRVTDWEAFRKAESSAAAVALSHEISLVSEFHKTYRYGMSSMSTTAGLEGTGTESRDAVAKARATWVGGAVEAGGEPRVIVVGVIGVVIVAVWVGSEI